VVHRVKIRKGTGGLLKHVVLILLLAYVSLPIIFLFLGSIKTEKEIIGNPFGFPSQIVLEHYRNAWLEGRLGSAMANTILVGVAVTVVIAFVAGLAAFSMNFLRTPGRGVLYALFLLAMQVPIHMYIVPLFIQWRRLHLVNTPLGIIIIYSAVYLPFSILFLKSQFAGLPRELIEAAEIDGCSYFRALIQIIFPVSRPAFVTISLINLKWVWNEFPLAITFLQDPEFQTMTPRYLELSAKYVSAYAVTSAGAVISVFPILIAYFLMQRHFVQGMTAGTIKA
jgi:raffinose/stachyose/melibiose transport system permease protein